MVSAWVSDKHEVRSCILLIENDCPSLTVYAVVEQFLLLLSLFYGMGLCVDPCFVVLYVRVFSRFAIITLGKRELAVLLLVVCCCHVAVGCV